MVAMEVIDQAVLSAHGGSRTRPPEHRCPGYQVRETRFPAGG